MSTSESRFGPLNLLVLVLSVYVLVAMAWDTFFHLPPETSALLGYLDTIICIVFLVDFAIRFKNAEDRKAFMKWGWIDLVSSIPFVDFARAGRLVRLVRLLRVIRAMRSVNHLVKQLFKKKAQGTFGSASAIAVLIFVFSAIAILQVEDDPTSNIKTAEDALWWAYTTITTVGYGDKYPVTTEGRIIASILMTCGVGLFGTFTAYIASWFVDDPSRNKESVQTE